MNEPQIRCQGCGLQFREHEVLNGYCGRCTSIRKILLTKREYDFRGIRKDNGKFVYGMPCEDESIDGGMIMIVQAGHQCTDRESEYDKDERDNAKEGCCCYHEIIPETIGQYTGKKDNTDKKIYGGDILSLDGRYLKIVKYSEEVAGFCLIDVENLPPQRWQNIFDTISQVWWNDFKDVILVVGDIHHDKRIYRR